MQEVVKLVKYDDGNESACFVFASHALAMNELSSTSGKLPDVVNWA